MTLSDENTLQAFRVLERNPEIGLVKAANFRRSDNKLGYAYLLTPEGIAEKAAVTARFLARKRREYIEIEQQIADLTREVELMRRESGER